MRRIVKNNVSHRTVVFIIFWLAGGGLFIPASAGAEKSVADEIITLEAAAKPLGEILENIVDAAGCQFTIDAAWEDYPITASFKNEPLYRVLKRIFRDFNNAIIYGSDRRIKIVIYDESASSPKKAGYSVAVKPAEAALSPTQPYSDATAPQPEVQVPEDGSNTENIEQPSEENTESVSEPNPAGTENTDTTVDSGEAQAGEKTAVMEPAESASDSSENSEKKESSEESN